MPKTKELGEIQRSVLKSLVLSGPYPGGWTYGSQSNTARLLESLVKRGLATKTETRGFPSYVANDAAVEVKALRAKQAEQDAALRARWDRDAAERDAAQAQRDKAVAEGAARATRAIELARTILARTTGDVAGDAEATELAQLALAILLPPKEA